METEAGNHQVIGTPPPSQPRMLARKLAEVMVELDRVPKNGYIQTKNGGSYPVATAADIFDAVRSELGKRHVIVIPRPKSHMVRIEGDDTITELTMDYELVDGDSGESFFIEDMPVRVVDSAKSDLARRSE